jgi:hypothetical protein
MIKYIVCILLLCPFFSLYAQSKSATVYVPPVTGTGGKPGDNDFFYKQLVYEVGYQKFILAKAKKDAEFSLVAALSAHPDNSPTGVKQYVLHLSIVDNKTGKSMSDGELIYEVAEDIKNLFPSLVYTLLFTIPEETGKDNWRDKILFAGVGAFWTPRIYTAESSSVHFVNFGAGIFAEYHFLNFLSVEAGVEIASDMPKVYAGADENYNNTLLEIPVLLKFVIKPGDHFILEPYGGIHLNIPFEKTTVPPLISCLAGIQYGVKAGPGVVFVDPRFSMDIGESAISQESDFKDISFQRYIIHIGVGYKIGFLTRR